MYIVDMLVPRAAQYRKMPPECSYVANVQPPYNFVAMLFYTVSSPM